MPLTFQVVNADAATARIGKAIGRMGHFAGNEMPNEMAQWQTADMHRHNAPMKLSRWRSHRRSVSTIIRPHSKFETLRSEAHQRKLLRRLRRGALRKAGERVALRFSVAEQAHLRLKTSTRPILRETLYEEFVQRMKQAFAQAIAWS
jgi:hypothetical protein